MSMQTERTMSAANAILEATDIALSSNPKVFVMGEGVTDPKGVFGTTAGLVKKYGRERILETPISENGFTGIAVGAALQGQRPIIIHQRVEFCLLAMEQIINNAAKLHYVTGGQHSVPLVIRLVIGRGWGQGPQHSQSLEALFSHIPGLKVVMPSTASDAKGLLLGAVEDNNPVIFLEHRWIHFVNGKVPEGTSSMPLDGPRMIREGNDITVVATSYSVLESMQAANALTEEAISVELFDLRILRPLHLQLIEKSVQKTGRLIFVDTGWKTFGIGAEVVAQITERCFRHLKMSPRRIGLPEQPTPSARTLAEAFYPSSEKIAALIGETLGADSKGICRVCSRLRQRRNDFPFDVPNPEFRGPF